MTNDGGNYTYEATVLTGDTDVRPLQPHHILISHQDALDYGISPFALLQVRQTPQSKPCALLQCIIDSPISSSSDQHELSKADAMPFLSSGYIQVHAWIHHTLQLGENYQVKVTQVLMSSPSTCTREWKIQMTPTAKYPLQIVSKSNTLSKNVGESWQPKQKSESIASILPPAVQSGKIDMTRIIQRQFRSIFGALEVFTSIPWHTHESTLLPVQIVGETFIFSIDQVDPIAITEGEPTPEPSWSLLTIKFPSSTSANVSPSVDYDLLSEQFGRLHVHDSLRDYREQLKARSWAYGFAGYTDFLHNVMLTASLRVSTSKSNLSPVHAISSRGILITGVHGVGKSNVLKALAHEFQHSQIGTWYLDGLSLRMAFENSSKATAYDFICEQCEQALPGFNKQQGTIDHPAVVLLDDLHSIFPPAEESQDEDAQKESPLASAFLRLMESLDESTPLCFIATAALSGSDLPIPSKAMRSKAFSKTIELGVPVESSRRDIIAYHCSNLPLDASSDIVEISTRLAALTGGYVAKDLVRICRNSLLLAHLQGDPKKITWNYLVLAQQQVKPSQLRTLNVSSPGIKDSNATADHASYGFAGYTTVKRKLLDFAQAAFAPTPTMERLGVSNGSGILLSGPSGCGKSLIVQALAAHTGVNFVSVKSSELLSKYFGDSEKGVRQLFARARKSSPCLLFFDEFDAIAHKRGFGEDDDGGGTGVYARVLSTFLNELDGVGSNETGQVLVVAATNRKQALDAALVRPGRIDRIYELDYPSVHDKEAILRYHTRKMPLAEDVDLVALAKRNTGLKQFSGADIAAVCKEAALSAIREATAAGGEWTCVRLDHLDKAWDARTATSSL